MNKLSLLGFAMICFVLAIVLPFIGIWSINTLFGLAIVCTFKNWFAMFLLMILFGKFSISLKTK